MRSAEKLEQQLGIPLLARVPEVSRGLTNQHGLVMFKDPHSHIAEAHRILAINLEFANSQLRARTIMVTSALEKEGKSATSANLAVALGRGGRKVILVDLDLRHVYTTTSTRGPPLA